MIQPSEPDQVTRSKVKETKGDAENPGSIERDGNVRVYASKNRGSADGVQEPRYECKLRKRGEGKGKGGAEERVWCVRSEGPRIEESVRGRGAGS